MQSFSLLSKIQSGNSSHIPKVKLNLFFIAGYRETAFAYAISAAGVAHSVARACSQGRLLECGCDPAARKIQPRDLTSPSIGPPRMASAASRWKWGGCSHNLHFGVEFSKLFLDSREQAGDIHSQINLHNNQAGRLVSSRRREEAEACQVR